MEYEKQESLPGLSQQEILETFDPQELLDYKDFLLEKYADLKQQLRLVYDELERHGILP